MPEKPLTRPTGLTTTQAADLCGVDRRTMLRYVQDGRVPSFRTAGGHFRIRPEDLSALLDELGIPATESLGAGPPRIAVLDDDQNHARALRRRIALTRPDAEIRLAHDGFSGGLLVADWVPDLLFLDLVMPGLDGFEVCRRIRASRRLNGVLIIVQSGIVDGAVRERLLHLGADLVLAKPLPPGQVEDVVGHLLLRETPTR